jgi:O-antigen ligase
VCRGRRLRFAVAHAVPASRTRKGIGLRSISDALSRVGDEQLPLRLAPPLLALSTATVTVAYYQVHGPTLHLLILLSMIWLYLRLRRRPTLDLGRTTWILAAVFLVYAAVAVLSAASVGFNAEALKRLERFSYFLAGATLIPFLIAARPRPLWFWLAIAATALLSGLFAAWEMQTLRQAFELATGRDYRAGGSKGKQIPFGDIATLVSILSLLAASVYAGTRRWLAVLFVIAALAGVYASVVSGTRGAWIFYPTGLLLVCLHLVQQYPASRRTILRGLLGLTLLGGLALSQSDHIQGRFATALSEIQAYTPGQGVRAGNALGERFEMWRAAWMAFESHPWLGIGVGQLNGYFKTAAERGLISRAIADFDGGNGHTHAHNDYIHALATRGVLGLISLLLLYLVPLAVFIRSTLTARGSAERGLGYAGILTILAYMQYSLTDSILMMRITGGFFVLLCGWLLALNVHRQDRSPPASARTNA